MSELDFAEIEKAMAELINKAQGKERQQGLHVAAKERSEKAKQSEVAHEQGEIATKRIIVASNNIRSNPRPRPQVMPPSPGRIMDFRTPSSVPTPFPAPIIHPDPETLTSEKDEDLGRTVGELSNEYLMEKLSEPDLEEVPRSDEPIFTPSSLEDSIESDVLPTDIKPTTSIEDITGPAPVMSTMQEPNMAIPSEAESPEATEIRGDKLPEADDLADQVGKVHKIYGQRLPKEYLNNSRKNRQYKEEDRRKSKEKKTKGKSGKGFAFYFVLLMVVASLAVWGTAAYLYFAY